MSRRIKAEVLVTPTIRRPGTVAQDDLWLDLLNLADAVESMVRDAAQSLCGGSDALARAVKDQEPVVDRWEVRIEEDCLRVLALYGPVASDLRRIVSALKLRAELERVGDLATKIARRSARFHSGSDAMLIPESLEALARMAADTFEQAVSALHGVDAVTAQTLIVADRRIDRQYRTASQELKDALRCQPESVRELLRLLNSARNLERIGDHSVKIARAILFICG
jgi:phosphate transport system protein